MRKQQMFEKVKSDYMTNISRCNFLSKEGLKAFIARNMYNIDNENKYISRLIASYKKDLQNIDQYKKDVQDFHNIYILNATYSNSYLLNLKFAQTELQYIINALERVRDYKEELSMFLDMYADMK